MHGGHLEEVVRGPFTKTVTTRFAPRRMLLAAQEGLAFQGWLRIAVLSTKSLSSSISVI